MRAVGIKQHGDLDAIEELQLPVPKLNPDEVLVKVHFQPHSRAYSPRLTS